MKKIRTALALMNSMILSGESHSEQSRQIFKEALEELDQQNAPDRGKVKIIFDGFLKQYNIATLTSQDGEGDDILINETIDALCSIALPTLSDWEIEKLWDKYCYKHTLGDATMDFKAFKASLK